MQTTKIVFIDGENYILDPNEEVQTQDHGVLLTTNQSKMKFFPWHTIDYLSGYKAP